MRNKLAEDVLNENMLHLMKLYQQSLGNGGEKLASTIEFLQHTSILVKTFRDHRPISNYEDTRLDNNTKALLWFRNWEKQIKESDVENKEKHLISFQTREVIVSLLVGFDEMCDEKFKSSSGSIIPNRINSDAIENIFSQQRGLHNGANTNPNYLMYSRSVNSIILGQPSISRKSNTGGGTGAQMYTNTNPTNSTNSERQQPLHTSVLQNRQ